MSHENLEGKEGKERLITLLKEALERAKKDELGGLALSYYTTDGYGTTYLMGDPHATGHTLNHLKFGFAQFLFEQDIISAQELEQAKQRFEMVENECQLNHPPNKHMH